MYYTLIQEEFESIYSSLMDIKLEKLMEFSITAY